MANKKSTRRALFMSIISLLLCCSMLVGTTFAWFTDEVVSGKNQIKAGNLDIELEYSKDFQNWNSVAGQDDLIDPNALWEPGHTEVVYLRISNLGTLALKYQFAMTVVNAVVGTSVEGNEIHLADHLKYAVVDVASAYADRDTARAAVEGSAKALAAYTDAGKMEADDAAKTVALVVYMPEDVGNEANYRGTDIPTIELGLELTAAQLTNEYDSFGNDYDAEAKKLYEVTYTFSNPEDASAFEPSPDNGTDNTGLTIQDGVAVINSSGAWFEQDVDLASRSYTIEYDLDITDLTVGQSVTVDTGEGASWGSTPIYIERGSAIVYYGLAKNEYIGELEGTNLHIVHTYGLNAEGKLNIATTVSDGAASVSYAKAVPSNPDTKLYWDIYTVTEASKATMDNFCFATYEATVDSPAELQTALQNGIGNEAATIELAGNITLSGEWTPIGDKDKGEYFTGTFDGNGYSISGLNVGANDYDALISAAKDATIKNLTVSGTVNGVNAAGIVARVEGETVIENCVSNVVVSGSTKAGGIVCNVTGADAKIIGCVNNMDVSGGTDGIGGIVGYVNGNANLEIISCTNNGNVTGSKYAGAAVGHAAGTSTGKVINMKNTGIITGTLLSDGRYLKSGDTVLCGFVGTIGNWKASRTDENGIVYYEDADELILSSVPAEFEGDTLNAPEGVTAIGDYAFSSNSNVKTVILPSTVTDLGRGFDTSTVEKVVLNEGLTTISSRAFKATSALKEVVISSTVTTIADDAFQKTGLKTITIPATVEYVGAQAFGASAIETVIFEGNTTIQNKAFRGCASLRTVYLNGDDITFENTTGQANCWFCNSESNNPGVSNITFYVKNAAVAAKVRTAMGAEAGNTKIIITPSAPPASLFDTISNLKSGDTLIVPEGTYITSGSFQVPAGVTIEGAEDADVVFHQNSAAQDNLFDCAGDVVFRNITFESNRKGYAIADNTKNHDTDGDITVIGCTFKGLATEKNWGIYKNLNGNLTVENCTFDNYNNALCGINNGNGSTTTITGCTFTNISGEAIGYVASTMPATFESDVIANNTGLTAENVIGY